MILHYYGEPEAPATIDAHLNSCEDCMRRYEQLRRMLESVDTVRVPERGPLYGSEVWNRLRPQLPTRQKQKAPVMSWKSWAAVAAMLVVGVSGYYMGKRANAVAPAAETAATDPFERGRQRVLMVALTDHFEKSRMILAELSNADPGSQGSRGAVDISYERDEASDLLESNRLYRQAALQQGDTQAASLLDDLERTLVELAHSPDQVGTDEFEALQQRIQDRGLVFKVRIFTSRMEDLNRAPLSQKSRTKGQL
ncbi:hypothetical protein F183_A36440 [Bryobacterales bacterium F-183]|nr:hypothetical protein F183_A36440 [Bryobacterales bacterium F-183]